MYVIDSGGQQTIVNAMRTLEGLTATSNGTCVQFRERDAANDASFINIHNGSGCSSYVSVHWHYNSFHFFKIYNVILRLEC